MRGASGGIWDCALPVGLTAALLVGVAPAAAQVAAPPATVEGPRTFTPEDFARFAPRNALEMLRQVPGFIILQPEQERGLGQATGNVLINGQRLSGKSNDVVTQLSRIAAQNVIRIEILDGATLDIPGLSGQVANVVAQATGISGQFSWNPEFRAYVADPRLTRFELSVSGVRRPVEYTFSLDNQANRSSAAGPTRIFNPAGEPIDFRHDAWTGNSERPGAAARFVIDGPGSSVGNLNLTYRKHYFDYDELGHRSGPGQPDRVRTVTQRERGREYEVGGDYEFAFGPGRLKLIGLQRGYGYPAVTDLVTSYADLSPDTGSRFVRNGDQNERILRGEYRLSAVGSDWQLSVENAFNRLDNVSELYELSPSGELVEVPLPGGSARVEEDRWEAMATWGRTLSPTLSVQLSAGGEYSQLSQTGDGGLTRRFWRPKGLASAAWKPSPATDVNLKIQRRVGQLNFYDFLASVNLGDDRENAANPDLVPPQSWEVDLETVRNLGIWGTTTLRLYARLFEDIVDTIPIGLTGESPGNIDSAIVYGAEWKGTWNFDHIGWLGAKLDSRFQIQRSRVDDPLTGLPRPISNRLRYYAELNLRHDVPGTDWAWGSNVSYQLAELNYRLTEVGRQWEGPVWANLFLEHKNVRGLTVRGTIGNILGADSFWTRTVYQGRRTGPIAFIERRDRIIGPIFSLSVSGRF